MIKASDLRRIEADQALVDGLPDPDRPEIEPLEDPESIGGGRVLDASPPTRHYLVPGLIPYGIVGMFVGAGGTGKTMNLLQLGIATAIRGQWLGQQIEEPGGALIITTEDDMDETHRRFSSIVQCHAQRGEIDDVAKECLRERLFVASRVGKDTRLTTMIDRLSMRTSIGPRIAALVKELPPLRLIVLDPISRLQGGDENNNESATFFIETIEALRAETGATIILAHHSRKDGLGAGTDRLTQDAVRGASGFVGGVRWVGMMAGMRRDITETFGLQPDDAGRFVRFDVVKQNYGAPWPGMWLERSAGGVLVPADLEQFDPRQAQQARRDEDRYAELLPKLCGLVAQEAERGRPLTQRRLRDYAGLDGLFGVGDKTLRSILQRAIAEGKIRPHVCDDGKTTELRTW